MNEESLARETSRILKELFPEPTGVSLDVPTARPGVWHRGTPLVAAAAVGAIALGLGLGLGLTHHGPNSGGPVTPVAGAIGSPGAKHSPRTAVSPSTRHTKAPATTRPATTVPTVPKWAKKCLPHGKDNLGPAPGWVGMTYAEVWRYAHTGYTTRHISGEPVYVGGGGRCNQFTDLVLLSRPVSLVFSEAIGPHGMPASAQVIAAVRGEGKNGWSFSSFRGSQRPR